MRETDTRDRLSAAKDALNRGLATGDCVWRFRGCSQLPLSLLGSGEIEGKAPACLASPGLVREREGGDRVPDPLAQAALSTLRLRVDICSPREWAHKGFATSHDACCPVFLGPQTSSVGKTGLLFFCNLLTFFSALQFLYYFPELNPKHSAQCFSRLIVFKSPDRCLYLFVQQGLG